VNPEVPWKSTPIIVAAADKARAMLASAANAVEWSGAVFIAVFLAIIG
jgi:hypothetical protein